MGPQLDSCGKFEADVWGQGDIELQWGRNLIVAERLFGLLDGFMTMSFNGAAT